MSWREQAAPDREGFGLGELDSDESVEVTFLDDGTLKETEHGDALSIGVSVHSIPDGYTDMNDNEVETVDENEEAEYNLMSSSKRLMYELAQVGENLAGASVVITAYNESNSFDRTYTVEEV